MEENIEIIQEFFQLPVTGSLDNNTIKYIDNYAKDNKHLLNKDIQNIVQRNNNFGLSSENTISDIRNLVIDSIVNYETDKYINKVSVELGNILVEKLNQESDIINTFIDNDHRELAVKYAKGGIIKHFDEGGKIKAGELAKLITENPELMNRVMRNMGTNSLRRTEKAIQKMMQDPNIEYTFDEYGLKTVGGRTSQGGYSAAQGTQGLYVGQVERPSLLKRIFTGGENKVQKALSAITLSDLNRSNETNNQPSKQERTCPEGKQQYKEFPGECLTFNEYVDRMNSQKEEQSNTTNEQQSNQQQTNQGQEENNSGAASGGTKIDLRAKEYNSWCPRLQNRYKQLWNENGGARANQNKIHAFIKAKMKEEGLFDSNNQPVCTESESGKTKPNYEDIKTFSNQIVKDFSPKKEEKPKGFIDQLLEQPFDGKQGKIPVNEEGEDFTDYLMSLATGAATGLGLTALANKMMKKKGKLSPMNKRTLPSIITEKVKDIYNNFNSNSNRRKSNVVSPIQETSTISSQSYPLVPISPSSFSKGGILKNKGTSKILLKKKV